MIKMRASDKYSAIVTFVALICIITSVAVSWWVMQGSFMLTPDSYHYLSAAASFQAKGIFLNPDGSYYTQWPPLFPFILSWLYSSPQAMIILFLLCKICIGILIYSLANRFLTDPFLKIIYLITVMASIHLLLITVFLWSEIIFLLLLLVHVYATLQRERSKAYYFLLILSGFLLCLQRHAGLYWIVATAIWFLMLPDITLRKRLLTSIPYFISCSAGLVSWFFYTAIILQNNTPFTARKFFVDILSNINFMLENVGHTFFPIQAGTWIVGLIILAGVYYYWFKYFRYDSAFALIAIGVVVYMAGFIPISGFNSETMERFFAVIVPLFFLLVVKVIEHLLVRFPTRATVLRFAILVWLVYPVARMGKNALYWHEVNQDAVSHK